VYNIHFHFQIPSDVVDMIVYKLTLLIWNGLLYNLLSILVLLGGKNWRNYLVGPIIVACPILEIWGPKYSRASLRHKMPHFGVKNFASIAHSPLIFFYTLIYF